MVGVLIVLVTVVIVGAGLWPEPLLAAGQAAAEVLAERE